MECARLRIKRSGFKPWPRTLCCVVGQDTLLSQCLSPFRCINGTGGFDAGGNLGMDQHFTQGGGGGGEGGGGGVEILSVASC